MKLQDIIDQLQKINEKHNNPEVAFRDPNCWRQFKNGIKIKDQGFITVVDGDFNNYVPLDVLESDRGYNAEYTEELLEREVKQVLIIG